MGTKANPGAFDCHGKAEPDEPVFTLLGRDRHGPTLVWLWSVLRELDGEDPAVVAEARVCASEMIAYATQKGRPVAGIGTSALAAVLELIRACNHLITDSKTQPTGIEFTRAVLALTKTALEK